jgi:hypothetical protein
MTKRTLLALFAFLSFLNFSSLQAQTILFENPITGTNINQSPYVTGQTTTSGVTVSGISRGSGIASVSAKDEYEAKDWTTSTSIDLNDYFEWTLTPSCKTINFNQLIIQINLSSISSPSRVQLRSSNNNFSSAIKIDSFTTTGVYNLTYDISSIINKTSTITFRLYGYRASDANKSRLSVRSFSFTGNLTPYSPTPYPLGANAYYIWNGLTSTEFSNGSNWYYYNGSTYTEAKSVPNASHDVLVPSGACVQNPMLIATNANVDSLIIFSGASVTLKNAINVSANDDVKVYPGATLDLGVAGATFEIKDGSLKLFGNSILNSGNCKLQFHSTISHTDAHTLIAESNSNNQFYDLDFHGDSEISMLDFTLGNDISVSHELKVSTNNFNLNGHSVNLGSTGTIIEGQNGKKIYDLGTGFIQSTVNILDKGVAYNAGNLGLTILAATGKPLGNTTVKRYHTAITGFLDDNFNTSINRYFDVTPEFNGGTGNAYPSGLDATITFDYLTADLNSQQSNETMFVLYRKGAGESVWQKLGGSINQNSKYLTFSGFPKFSIITIGVDGQALPVELLSFNGNCTQNQSVELTWETASEHNSNYFQVEKSFDGKSWNSFSKVVAAGNSNDVIQYNAIDEHLRSSNAYYRLRQVDFDGKEKLYDPINVTCNESSSTFMSHPNPSKAGFQIVLNDNNFVGNQTLTITDATGKTILSKQLNVLDGINVFPVYDEFNPGIYFLSISDGNNKTKMVKHLID